MVGFVPVLEVITFEIKAGFEAVTNTGGSLETGFDQTTQIRAGAEYKDSKWASVWEKSAELKKHDTIWPQKADFRIKSYVRPAVSIKLYAVAGPYIDVVPYLEFDGSTGGEYAWLWELSAGIESNLGFNVSAVGYGIADYSTNLLAWETVIASDYQESNGGDPHEIHGLTFVTIPTGSFRMGDIQNYDRFDREKPVHDVTISSFEMSIYEVTNAQYASYLTEALSSGDITANSSTVYGKTGGWSGEEYLDISSEYCEIEYKDGTFKVVSGRENYPVIEVSWYGSKAFAEYYGLDLPTEAEWEYACRAGTKMKFYTGNNLSSDDETSADLDEAGWYWGNSDTGGDYPWTHPVGQKKPNDWGLYDMHGNVWEWCSDWYGESYYSSSPSNNPTGPASDSYRVIRGGGWSSNAGICRSACRYRGNPANTDNYLGFRVVCRLYSNGLPSRSSKNVSW